jgi:argininosuccinate lyase
MRWGEEWEGGSFIMPQKRNPSWLKPVRQAGIDVANGHAKAVNEYLNTAPMLLVGLIEVPSLVHRGLDDLSYGMSVLAAALPTMKLDAERGRHQASSDFIQSAQLVHELVKSNVASWRQAEVIVGRFMRGAIAAGSGARDLRIEELAAIAREEGVELAMTQQELDRCFDPAAIVASRGDSGPAPQAVRDACAAHRSEIEGHRRWLAGERSRLSQVWTSLENAARGL